MASFRLWLLAPLAVMALAPAAMAADATIAQVHEAAAAGHIDQALALMAPVLKDHPASAKAHYVEAELLARAHRLDEARGELAKAESLAPGLPFAKSRSVGELKAQLAGTTTGASTSTIGTPAVAPASQGFPWTPVIIIGLIIFGVLAFFRRRSAQNTPVVQQGGFGQPGYGQPGYGQQGYGGQGPWGGQPGGMMGGGMMGGGMGGGILGGLASGAAMGAGFVAGEALVERVIGGGHGGDRGGEATPVQSGWDNSANQDMGGDDFGISDGGSWDDGGSSGGDW